MTTNSHMFAVQGTTFGAFCAASFFHPCLYSPRLWVLWKCSCSRRELPHQCCNSTPPHPHSHPSFLLASVIAVCIWESAWSVRIPVCVCSMKGARAAEVQSLVHVLKCSPRDGPYYPCLLHQQGPGARAGSWSFVSKQMEIGRGEEKWRIREKEEEEVEGRSRMDGGRRRGGRKSQSVLIKCCIEEDVPPQCVSNRGCSPSHSGSRSDHLYHRVCHKVCVHALGPGIRPSLAS